MSGDVQPRKRKDKKKKKEDEDSSSAAHRSPHSKHTSSLSAEDVQKFHVHKDPSTGGHWCAKIVFFILMAALVGVIGLIILENRGLTDLDAQQSESRYADVFEGWLEETNHHEEDHHEGLQHAHHHDDDEDEDEHHGHDDDGDGDEEDHHGHDDEDDDEDEDHHDDDDEEEDDEHTKEVSEEEEEGVKDEDEEDDNSLNEDEEEVGDGDNDEEEEDEDVKQEESVEDKEEEQGSPEQEEESYIKRVVEDLSEEIVFGKGSHYYPPINDNEDEDKNEESQEKDQNVSQDVKDADEDDDDDDIISNEIPGVKYDNDDDDNAPFEEIEDDEIDSKEEQIIEHDDEDDVVHDEDAKSGEQEAELLQEEVHTSGSGFLSVPIKLLIGLAMLICAHQVFMRRKRFDRPTNDEHEATPDLSRRTTLISPDIEFPDKDDAEYSEEEDEDMEEEEEEEYSNEEDVVDGRISPQEVKEAPILNTKEHQTFQSYMRQEQPVTSDDKKQEEVEEEEDEEIEYEEEEEEIEDEEEENEQEGHHYEDDEEEGIEEEEEEEEGEIEEEEEVSDVDDDELMKKLEAKYGKLTTADETKATAAKKPSESGNSFTIPTTVDEDENPYRHHSQDFDNARKFLDENPSKALVFYNKILEDIKDTKNSAVEMKALLGRAQCLDKLAEIEKSNQILDRAIEGYSKIVLDFSKNAAVDEQVLKIAASRCIERMRFKGAYTKAVPVHEALIEKYPNEAKHQNDLAVTLLMGNRPAEAFRVLHRVLQKWRDDGLALVHYGFILKTSMNELERGVKYLQEGIRTKQNGTMDGRFLFHLGDGLQRLGRNEEAMQVYETGVEHKIFLSKYQRSLYNIDRLKSRPWWTVEQTGYQKLFDTLQSNWKAIRGEGLAVLDMQRQNKLKKDKQQILYRDEAENLRDTGDWKQFELYSRGVRNHAACSLAPITCRIISGFSEASSCTRGQIKFSLMEPGTHVWPHCGPTNCRLRAHLGLKVEEAEAKGACKIRVAEESRSWKEGEILIFDDSFEHEVWHNGTNTRLVLIVDVWHPDITPSERKSLQPI